MAKKSVYFLFEIGAKDIYFHPRKPYTDFSHIQAYINLLQSHIGLDQIELLNMPTTNGND
jgi:hypothetical protein